ncbi:MAG: hypothetical protein JSS81_16545 [Acidobacteria bacterium]|nr:hypothetical protein [Acidobacteriota bacterium]
MRRISWLALVLLLIFDFFAGGVGAVLVFEPFQEQRNTWSMENETAPEYEVLVFTPRDVHVVPFGNLNEFKERHPDYSFLVPPDKVAFYNARLARRDAAYFRFEATRITADRQSIRLSGSDKFTHGFHVYEATDKEVFPKTATSFSYLDDFYQLVIGMLGGGLFCFACYFIYRKLAIF